MYVKGEPATPIPGPQGPPGAPVSNIYHCWLYSSKSQLSKTMYFCFFIKNHHLHFLLKLWKSCLVKPKYIHLIAVWIKYRQNECTYELWLLYALLFINQGVSGIPGAAGQRVSLSVCLQVNMLLLYIMMQVIMWPLQGERGLQGLKGDVVSVFLRMCILVVTALRADIRSVPDCNNSTLSIDRVIQERMADQEL